MRLTGLLLCLCLMACEERAPAPAPADFERRADAATQRFGRELRAVESGNRSPNEP